jgi:hypothetical protein
VSRFKLTKKRLAGVTAVVAVAVAGLAIAFWTAGGSGTGTGSTGTVTSGITVTQTSTVSGLTPGTGSALAGKFKNSNTSAVNVSSVTATVDAFSTQTDAAKPACTQADYEITGGAVSTPNKISASQSIPARAGFDANPDAGSWSGLTVSLKQGAGNQDNCKGQAIGISYTSD